MHSRDHRIYFFRLSMEIFNLQIGYKFFLQGFLDNRGLCL
jgi:hypothetical protein